ncbi:LOW QUALITY PROTEIN: hypothetical protein JCM24511_08333 [Saitozyma sp. JCM 24511]|nr:LOW QUALITY PROTEIN: hypothetical protein JCM24511_08333 [Saitozyma sp. JCM 24511]
MIDEDAPSSSLWQWFFLGLGLVLGMILVVCIYINWRGPNRVLIPCLGVRGVDGEGTELEAGRNGGGSEEEVHAEGNLGEKVRFGTVTTGEKGFIAGSVVSAQEVQADKRTSRKLHKARSSSVLPESRWSFWADRLWAPKHTRGITSFNAPTISD